MTGSKGGMRWWGWTVSLGLMALIVLLATLTPFVSASWRVVLMQSFAPICHQMAERSFHIDGVALAVCHRCYGIYWGLFVAPLLYLLVRRWQAMLWAHSRLLVAVVLTPMFMDWTLDFLGLWQNTPLTRVLTGGVFGLGAGLLVAEALAGPDPQPQHADEPTLALAKSQP